MKLAEKKEKVQNKHLKVRLNFNFVDKISSKTGEKK